jgi:hypothetical protein
MNTALIFVARKSIDASSIIYPAEINLFLQPVDLGRSESVTVDGINSVCAGCLAASFSRNFAERQGRARGRLAVTALNAGYISGNTHDGGVLLNG